MIYGSAIKISTPIYTTSIVKKFQLGRFKKSPLPQRKESLKLKPKTNYFFAYFLYLLMNLSTRPAVSTNLDLPVKKGCELLEISTFTTG